MKVLLTGGAGFIGSHVAERLLARGDQLAIVDNLNSFYDPEIKRANLREVRSKRNFEFYENDIRDKNALDAVFHQVMPEKIIHLAAYPGVRPSLENPVLYSEVNITGTIHLLELARQHRIQNFVFGSSSSVYGINSKVPFNEDDPIVKPISPYAATKRAGELLCYNYHHNYGLKSCCLRFFTVYGPRQRPEMAIHKFARLIIQRRMLPVYAQGKSERDYTFVDDIVDGVTAALDRDCDFEIINLGNSRTVKLMEVIVLLERALGMSAQLQELPPQRGDPPITYADIKKAQELLGYQPKVPIEEGITRFVEWFRKRGLGAGG
ncbi:MAG TPA: GDP-mannose 4,6-dehydratase [Acidobacteriota bacterium]|nr:GDP-mannose 4,6-dehydratase [Acidobacteriota bacterium]